MFDKYIGAERMNTFARVMILSYFFNHASVNLPILGTIVCSYVVNFTVLLLQLQLLLLLLLLPHPPPHFSRLELIRTNVELCSPSLTPSTSTPLHAREHSYTGLEIWWYYRQPFPWINFWLIPASILVGKVN